MTPDLPSILFTLILVCAGGYTARELLRAYRGDQDISEALDGAGVAIGVILIASFLENPILLLALLSVEVVGSLVPNRHLARGLRWFARLIGDRGLVLRLDRYLLKEERDAQLAGPSRPEPAGALPPVAPGPTRDEAPPGTER